MFIEQSLPLSSSSSVRSGIDLRFAMSLLTELDDSKGSVSYKYCAPSGAGSISSFADSRPSQPRCMIWVSGLRPPPYPGTDFSMGPFKVDLATKELP
jgi:hypothetical protein